MEDSSPTHSQQQNGSQKVERKPMGYYRRFNEWFQAQWDKAGRRPGVKELTSWYAKNAETFFGPDPPSLKELKQHSRRIRPVQVAKQYHALYYKLVRKPAMGKEPGPFDGELNGAYHHPTSSGEANFGNDTESAGTPTASRNGQAAMELAAARILKLSEDAQHGGAGMALTRQVIKQEPHQAASVGVGGPGRNVASSASTILALGAMPMAADGGIIPALGTRGSGGSNAAPVFAVRRADGLVTFQTVPDAAGTTVKLLRDDGFDQAHALQLVHASRVADDLDRLQGHGHPQQLQNQQLAMLSQLSGLHSQQGLHSGNHHNEPLPAPAAAREALRTALLPADLDGAPNGITAIGGAANGMQQVVLCTPEDLQALNLKVIAAGPPMPAPGRGSASSIGSVSGAAAGAGYAAEVPAPAGGGPVTTTLQALQAGGGSSPGMQQLAVLAAVGGGQPTTIATLPDGTQIAYVTYPPLQPPPPAVDAGNQGLAQYLAQATAAAGGSGSVNSEVLSVIGPGGGVVAGASPYATTLQNFQVASAPSEPALTQPTHIVLADGTAVQALPAQGVAAAAVGGGNEFVVQQLLRQMNPLQMQHWLLHGQLR